MIKIFRSLPETQSLKAYVENEYGLSFDNFSLYRDIGGAVYFTNAASKKFVFKLSIAPYSEKAIKASCNRICGRNISMVYRLEAYIRIINYIGGRTELLMSLS